ncbi:MAG TPA: MBL fold metallo-hydrolase [Kiritimatiellia bacterium]|jgi:metallo-beta-lactamase family protein|nr:MBL fold metallo-hydrolase [Kiritimatiellia bacterium]HOM58824.1 MBL fold metallo-hydrolase [Kiritimatiellia bacterium]HOR96774.1 MBL fold metallo-hydrolase [Kiritimatiellia bacterium]HPK37706.1 MBL fold metallo-hydrolase [Kiritimatiellia bacterium]HPW74373.1 MBL fold metallo-hydrolase [Kiritimatiellia bacterium]
MMKLTFFGAAQTTTGSMHLVEANGKRILLDCGLFQGHRKEAFEKNRNMPIDPRTLDAVVLSHAHIDHSGNLPTLARHGFRGKVYCTPATRDLCDIMLRDSAYLQQRDLEYVNKKRAQQGKVLFEPLYEQEDVDHILSRFEPEPLKRLVDLGDGISLLLHNAGHILGSALVQLDVKTRGGTSRRLLFTGDLGQPDRPILRDYDFPQGADTILIESTYADRDHPAREDVSGRLKGFVEDIHQQKARLIIPAFSVGRTQHLLYELNRLIEQRRMPLTPVYVDSPLSLKATQVYARHRECYDEEASDLLRQGIDPLRFPGLQFVETPDQSKALNDRPGPMIIIAASGMCEGGRILHHLRQGVGDPRNIILIVGFQAENTLGRRIVERRSPLKILGDEFELNARVHTINALSAHADRTALMRWFDAVRGKRLKRVFAVHGEPEKVQAMIELVRARGVENVVAPQPGQKFEDV